MNDLQIEKKVKKIAKEKDVTIKNLCKAIGMTENGFASALKNNTLKIETLQKISEFFEVDLCFFFGGNTNNNEDFKTIIQDKEAEIIEMKKYIRTKDNLYDDLVSFFINKDELNDLLFDLANDLATEFIEKNNRLPLINELSKLVYEEYTHSINKNEIANSEKNKKEIEILCKFFAKHAIFRVWEWNDKDFSIRII